MKHSTRIYVTYAQSRNTQSDVVYGPPMRAFSSELDAVSWCNLANEKRNPAQVFGGVQFVYVALTAE